MIVAGAGAARATRCPATGQVREATADAMPRRRCNTAADAAAVVSMLLSDAAVTLTGQVINAEGGFRRTR